MEYSKGASSLSLLELDDLREAGRVEAGSPDQRPVDLGLLHEAADVLRLDAAAVLDPHPGCRLAAEPAGDLLPDQPGDAVGFAAGGGLAGSDGPDGLVGDHQLAGIVELQPLDDGPDLPAHHLLRLAAPALVQGLADAGDDADPFRQGRLGLPADVLVGLVEVGPPLRMPDDDVVAAQVFQHHRRDLAGVRPLVRPEDVLGAQLDPGAFDHLGHRVERGKRGAEHHLHPLELIAHQDLQLLGQADGLRDRLVHLPVAGNDGFSHHYTSLAGAPPSRSRSAATPGSSFPSRNSRLAPPPVETCDIFSASPACCTAAAESPPPMMLKAPDSATARATARVPSAKGAISKTPMGPFHSTVFAP